MRAIVRIGGRQYPVEEGATISVDRRPGAPGDRVAFDEVLFVHDGTGARIGTPTVPDARVVAEIEGHGRARKVMVTRFRRRKASKRRRGHRQPYTTLRIERIEMGEAPGPAGEAPPAGEPSPAGEEPPAAEAPAAREAPPARDDPGA